MEPIKHTRTASFRPFKMYREELDQLVSLFQASCESVVISDRKYRYKSLDDMKTNAGARIRDIDIRGARPGLHLLLNQQEFPTGSKPPVGFNELRAEDITDEAEALFFVVREFLSEHQRPDQMPYLLLVILGATSAITASLYHNVTAPQGQWIRIAIIVGGAIVFVLGMARFTALSRNELILEKRLNSQSFFVRNREEFGKYAIAAVIGGAIGMFFEWLLSHFPK